MQKKLSMLLAILTLLGSLSLLPVSAAQNEDNTDPTQPETLTATDAPTGAPAEVAADPPTEAPTDSPTEAPGEKAFPVINNVVPSANGVTVSWTAVEGASKYIVYAKKNGEDFAKLGDVCALSYEHCLTPNNTPYTYSVQAVDQNGDPIGDFMKTALPSPACPRRSSKVSKTPSKVKRSAGNPSAQNACTASVSKRRAVGT